MLNSIEYYYSKLATISGWTEQYCSKVRSTYTSQQLVGEVEDELWLAHLGADVLQIDALASLSDELYNEYPELFI